MKKPLSLLLLCSSIFFSSHAACADSSIPNFSPQTRPQALWTVKGETTVALAFWAALQPKFIYLRVEEGVDKKKNGKEIIAYENAFDRRDTLKALREGTFVKLYKDSPIAPSVMPKRELLESTVEKAFDGKNERTSELRNFCDQVDYQLDLVQRNAATPTDLPNFLAMMILEK